MDAMSLLQGTSYLFPLTSISGKKPSEAGSAHDAQSYLITSGTARCQPCLTYRDPPPGSGASTPTLQAGTQDTAMARTGHRSPRDCDPTLDMLPARHKNLRGKNHFTFWVHGYQSERVAQKNASASSVISSVDRPAPRMS